MKLAVHHQSRREPTGRLSLPTVTLCAVTSVNVTATVAAMEACLEQIAFADALLLTDAEIVPAHPELRVEAIPRLRSTGAYSAFILNELVDHVQSAHVLVVQWDGFVLDARVWDPTFLEFDYVGAPWPQFRDGHDVGNGGFSLRSRHLLQACRDPSFRSGAAEDVAICRVNRAMLEKRYGVRFADRATAERFAFERSAPVGSPFGFHGVFNLIAAVGPERFWELYCGLDDRTSAFVDYGSLMRQLGDGPKALSRRVALTAHRVRHMLTR